MRPTLLCLDFSQRTARRYWPKPTGGGFMTQLAKLEKPAGDPWQLGNTQGLALLDDFRLGRLSSSDYDIEDQPEQA